MDPIVERKNTSMDADFIHSRSRGVNGLDCGSPNQFSKRLSSGVRDPGNGAGINKFQITTEGLGLGSVNGFAFSEDTGRASFVFGP